jgi:hypothetical protein
MQIGRAIEDEREREIVCVRSAVRDGKQEDGRGGRWARGRQMEVGGVVFG